MKPFHNVSDGVREECLSMPEPTTICEYIETA